MKCPTCGRDNPENAQFCGVCGTNLISGEVSVGTELPMVGFGQAISRGFSNYFTFSGRATRAEYWFWTLFSTLVQGIPLVGWLIGLAVLIPSIAVTSRRLHDIGKSAWWMTVWLLLGGVWVLWSVGFVLEVIGLEERVPKPRSGILGSGIPGNIGDLVGLGGLSCVGEHWRSYLVGGVVCQKRR